MNMIKLISKFILAVNLPLLVILLQSCSSGKNSASADVNNLTPDIGKFTDSRDDKTYKTTKIGEQIWMAENLNYNINESMCYDDNSKNCEKYGRLFNWETAMKVCPTGWHLPKNEEWDVLIGYVGNAGKLKEKNSWRSAYTLKSTLQIMILGFSLPAALIGWGFCSECYFPSVILIGSSLLIYTVLAFIPSDFSELVDDYYGFSALPGGNAEPNKKSKKIEIHGIWWSATERYSDAYYKLIFFAQNEAIDGYYDKKFLLSVRCVLD